MDYLKFVEHHRMTNADITIGCLPVDYERASDFGLMKIDEEGRIFVRVCFLFSAHCSFRCLVADPSGAVDVYYKVLGDDISCVSRTLQRSQRGMLWKP